MPRTKSRCRHFSTNGSALSVLRRSSGWRWMRSSGTPPRASPVWTTSAPSTGGLASSPPGPALGTGRPGRGGGGLLPWGHDCAPGRDCNRRTGARAGFLRGWPALVRTTRTGAQLLSTREKRTRAPATRQAAPRPCAVDDRRGGAPRPGGAPPRPKSRAAGRPRRAPARRRTAHTRAYSARAGSRTAPRDGSGSAQPAQARPASPALRARPSKARRRSS